MSIEELVLPIALAVSSLVFAATDTSLCLNLISPELAESRILHTLSAVIRPREPHILHCPATDSLRRLLFGDSLFLYDL